MKKIKVLGVCGGVGGCLFTFHKRKDFRVIGNIEPRAVFHSKKEEQWNINFKGLPFERDIIKGIKPDVIIGHPDCGDNSILRMSRAKKTGDVKINSSVNLFFRSINYYRPALFLLENLPGFLKTYTVDSMIDILDGKYELTVIQGSVSMFGNSQVSRVRLVILGRQKGLKEWAGLKPLLKNLIREDNVGKLHPTLPYGVNLGLRQLHPISSEAFEMTGIDNPSIGYYREPLEKLANLYHPASGRRKITYSEAQLLWQKLPSSCQRWPVGGKMKNQPGVSRHSVGKPPLTVRKQNRQFGTHNLVLSPREMANIQGFPLSFRLFVDLDERVYWLNKNRVAVTKCAPYEISLWLKKIIKQALF